MSPKFKCAVECHNDMICEKRRELHILELIQDFITNNKYLGNPCTIEVCAHCEGLGYTTSVMGVNITERRLSEMCKECKSTGVILKFEDNKSNNNNER